MEKTKVTASAWARASVESLEVTGDLFGQSHVFEHNERVVEIKLPVVEIGADLRPLGRGNEVATLHSSLAENPQLETTSYAIAWVEVTVALTEQLTLPVQLLQMSPKRPEIAGEQLTKRLDALAIQYEARLATALNHWEAVVRWVTGSSALGRPNASSGRGSALRLNFTSIVRASDQHRFWTPTNVVALHKGTEINAAAWGAIAAALAAGHEAPIWFRYLDEAHHRFMAWDVTGAVLSAAIACETLAREAFWLASGSPPKAARDLIDRVSIRAILERWHLLTSVPKSQVRISEVSKLFNLRNRLMHAGGTGADLDRQVVHNLLSAARQFICAADDWYFQSRGTENPRLWKNAS